MESERCSVLLFYLKVLLLFKINKYKDHTKPDKVNFILERFTFEVTCWQYNLNFLCAKKNSKIENIYYVTRSSLLFFLVFGDVMGLKSKKIIIHFTILGFN